jgi:predicted porin
VFLSNPTASYQNVSNYPDINSTMNSVELTATYKLMPDLDLVFLGTYTLLNNNDWNDTANAIQGAGITAVSILTPGYSSPCYSIATVMAGMKFRF